MKKHLTIPALLFAASLTAHSAAIHAGLVNYWALDGTGADSAGTFAGNASTNADDLTVEIGTNTGANAGGVSIESAGGLFGGSSLFERSDGTDPFTVVNTNGRLNAGNGLVSI